MRPCFASFATLFAMAILLRTALVARFADKWFRRVPPVGENLALSCSDRVCGSGRRLPSRSCDQRFSASLPDALPGGSFVCRCSQWGLSLWLRGVLAGTANDVLFMPKAPLSQMGIRWPKRETPPIIRRLRRGELCISAASSLSPIPPCSPSRLVALSRYPDASASLPSDCIRRQWHEGYQGVITERDLFGSHSHCIPRSIELRLQGDAFLV